MQDIVIREFIRLVDSGEIVARLREQHHIKIGGFTFGGPLAWIDVAEHRGWRIQKRRILDWYRVLDPSDHRHSSGTEKIVSECILGSHRPKSEETFAEFKRLIDEGRLEDRLEEQPDVNIDMPVVDAGMCWNDLVCHRGWRIQQNKVFKNCRILDPNGIRRASGVRDYVMKRIQGQSVNFAVNYLRDHNTTIFVVHKTSLRKKLGTVFLVHGWGVGEGSMEKMANGLCALGYDTYCYDYRSSRDTITGLAEDLFRHLQDAMQGAREPFFFLTHSMGGLLVRKVLELDRGNVIGGRIEQIVMLGPPNQGSPLADIATLFIGGINRSIGGMQTDIWSEVNRIRPPAHYRKPFGIIGGTIDGKVPRESLTIPNRHDEIIMVGTTHPGLRSSIEALELAHTFFQAGTFRPSR